jgi:hypothetical protein
MFTFHLHIWFTLNWTNNITLRFINFPFQCVDWADELRRLILHSLLLPPLIFILSPSFLLLFICHRVVKICSNSRKFMHTRVTFYILKLIYIIVDGMKIFVITNKILNWNLPPRRVWKSLSMVRCNRGGRVSLARMKCVSFPTHRTHLYKRVISQSHESRKTPHTSPHEQRR